MLVTQDTLPRVFWLYLAAMALIAAGYADFNLISFHLQKASTDPSPLCRCDGRLRGIVAGVRTLVRPTRLPGAHCRRDPRGLLRPICLPGERRAGQCGHGL